MCMTYPEALDEHVQLVLELLILFAEFLCHT